MAGSLPTLRCVLQPLVHRHLRPAVHLPGRMSDTADHRAHPQPARRAGTGTAQSRAAAQARDRDGVRHAGCGGPGHLREAARVAARGAPHRWRHRDLRRERLSARVRQHRVPLLAARPAGRDRGRQAVRLRGQCDRHRQWRARLLLSLTCRLRLVSGRKQRRRHVVVSDVCAGQRLPSPVPAHRAGHVVRLEYRLPGRGRPRQRHVAALPAGGQSPAAGRRGPGVSAGSRLRADVHRHLPEWSAADPDHPVAARQRSDAALLRHDPRRPARRAVPAGRATQTADSDHRTLRSDPATRRHAAVVEFPGAQRSRRRRRHLPR